MHFDNEMRQRSKFWVEQFTGSQREGRCGPVNPPAEAARENNQAFASNH